MNTIELVTDNLACGVDPAKCTIYLQSAIHAVYEINLIFEMLVTVPRLSRLPSLKDMARAADLNEMPFGLLGYPVLQAADIADIGGLVVGQLADPGHRRAIHEIIDRRQGDRLARRQSGWPAWS